MTMDVMDKHQIKHPDMVAGLAKTGEAIKADTNREDYNLVRHVCEEVIVAGDILDTAKKQFIYNKPRMMVAPVNYPNPPDITPEQWHAIHMAIGIAGEAAELLDAVLHNFVGDGPIDGENVIEELGDIEFYLEGFRQGFDFSRQDTLNANIAKLGKRYEGHKYSNEQANVRADKA